MDHHTLSLMLSSMTTSSWPCPWPTNLHLHLRPIRPLELNLGLQENHRATDKGENLSLSQSWWPLYFSHRRVRSQGYREEGEGLSPTGDRETEPLALTSGPGADSFQDLPAMA